MRRAVWLLGLLLLAGGVTPAEAQRVSVDGFNPQLPATLGALGGLRVECLGGTCSGGGGGGDGAIQDGVTASIEATVRDYTNSNPLAVNLTDATGDALTTLPVSGTVTANQGGAWSITNTAFGLTQTGSNNDVDVLSLPGVTIATFPDNEPVNVAQFGGAAVATGTGASGAGIPRVTVANDSVILAAQSGTWLLSTKTILTGSAPAAAAVGVASATAIASNSNRRGLVAVNTSTATISCTPAATAVLNSGITLEPGAAWNMNEYSFSTAAIACIASAAGSNLSYQEMVQ